MSTQSDSPYTALKTIFHEPNRLAIMSALSCAAGGLAFSELKQECALTDGNLSRHLKTLEEARAIRIEKTFVGVKPRTTVFLSDDGREQFLEYLKALQQVLQKATASLETTPSTIFISPPHTHGCTRNSS
ncbi:winged helix-turn-helix domain-containing protein [Candidatus Entotheonella palauensis]|nr:transcriptional regulator [Candidatus Entotheonella palauensis]